MLKRQLTALAFLLCLSIVPASSSLTQSAAALPLEIASVNSAEEIGNEHSHSPSFSADGRYVAFTSYSDNLGWLDSDLNQKSDVFVRDMKAGITVRVSVSSSEEAGNGTSNEPAISADGRYVAFTSKATNLVSGDEAGHYDVFVRDLKLGTTKRVSVSDTEKEGNNDSDPYDGVSISADGRYVAFSSKATNLIENDTNGPIADIFVRDIKAGTTKIVSVDSSKEILGVLVPGEQGDAASVGPSISGDGRYIVFESTANNLGAEKNSSGLDVFVRDTLLEKTHLVSVSSTDKFTNGLGGRISADGRFIAFTSTKRLVPDPGGKDWDSDFDIFLRDLQNMTTTQISVGESGESANDDSSSAAISGDGRYIVFRSLADNLVTSEGSKPDSQKTVADIFIHDTKLKTTKLVSAANNGSQGNASSEDPVISANGRSVAFSSYASNLSRNDKNLFTDVFVRDLWSIRPVSDIPNPAPPRQER